MLIEFRLLAGENERGPSSIIGPSEFLQQCKQVRSLEPMTETSKLSFEFAFAGKNVGPGLFDTHRLLRILFPLKAQARIRVCPLGDTQLERRRYIIERVLVTVEELLILLPHLRTQCFDRLIEVRL